MELLTVLATALLGFLTFHLTKYPNGKVGKRLPEFKFKAIQISPSIKIHGRGRTIHMHHWINFSILIIISLFIANPFLDHQFTRSFLAGGIIQGLSFADFKNVIYKQS